MEAARTCLGQEGTESKCGLWVVSADLWSGMGPWGYLSHLMPPPTDPQAENGHQKLSGHIYDAPIARCSIVHLSGAQENVGAEMQGRLLALNTSPGYRHTSCPSALPCPGCSTLALAALVRGAGGLHRSNITLMWSWAQSSCLPPAPGPQHRAPSRSHSDPR